MSTNRPIIALKNITKIYESEQSKFTALSGVNLEIYKGEIYKK